MYCSTQYSVSNMKTECVCVCMYVSRVLRKIFGPKKKDVTEPGENCIRKVFMICTSDH